MRNFRNPLAASGYDAEEAYFHKLNQELVEKQHSPPKLRLIQGGKSTGPLPKSPPLSGDYGKKKAA